MSKLFKKLTPLIIGVIAFLFVIVAVSYAQSFFNQIFPKSQATTTNEFKKWSLMVYDYPTPNRNYQILNLSAESKLACIDNGFRATGRNQSFECGYDCAIDSKSGLTYCNQVCEPSGSCRNY